MLTNQRGQAHLPNLRDVVTRSVLSHLERLSSELFVLSINQLWVRKVGLPPLVGSLHVAN